MTQHYPEFGPLREAIRESFTDTEEVGRLNARIEKLEKAYKESFAELEKAHKESFIKGFRAAAREFQMPDWDDEDIAPFYDGLDAAIDEEG